MPKSARPRKKYRKPGYDTAKYGRLPILFKVSGLEKNKLVLPHVHLDDLIRGSNSAGTFSATASWNIVVGRALWGRAMYTMFMDTAPPVLEVFDRAIAAMHAVRGKPSFDREEVGTVAEALNLTDALQEALTRREAAQALNWVKANHPIDVSGLIV